MKQFITYIKTLLSKSNSFSIGKPRKNKNDELYFCIFGLDAFNKAGLPQELQKAIKLANAVDGWSVSYTPPHKSTSMEGLLYFGPEANKVIADDFDVFDA